MNKFKTVITYWGVTFIIGSSLLALYIYILSWFNQEGYVQLYTNHFGERLIETFLLVTGVPCALYVLRPVVKKFIRRD